MLKLVSNISLRSNHPEEFLRLCCVWILERVVQRGWSRHRDVRGVRWEDERQSLERQGQTVSLREHQIDSFSCCYSLRSLNISLLFRRTQQAAQHQWLVSLFSFFSSLRYCEVIFCGEQQLFELLYTLNCQKYWHPLLMNRFDYFSNFHEYKS